MRAHLRLWVLQQTTQDGHQLLEGQGVRHAAVGEGKWTTPGVERTRLQPVLLPAKQRTALMASVLMTSWRALNCSATAFRTFQERSYRK